MSRLAFAPKLKEIEITDIEHGLAVFKPKPEQPVSFAVLQKALKQAGYKLGSAEISVGGTLAREGGAAWWLVNDASGQRFALAGANLERALEGAQAGARVEVTGDWKTVGAGAATREVISPRPAASKTPTSSVVFSSALFSSTLPPEVSTRSTEVSSLLLDASPSSLPSAALPLAPVRTTSPGLTVYKGGAFVARFIYARQRLGSLRVNRQTLQLSASYTPTPHLQLEAELPYSRTSFRDGAQSGVVSGFGNLTLRGKYRFYRKVEAWGDRQAAAQLGLELPTGQNRAPTEAELDAPPFVRQQLSPLSGGLAAHFDAAYSRARGRVILGGNVESVLRTERAGFRTGHELRFNTDLEYVLLPRKYRRPTKELFTILETNFVTRGRGRTGGARVEGSGVTEFYLAPALQYVASERLVVEASVQVPVARAAGAQVLRTSLNTLFGARYLF